MTTENIDKISNYIDNNLLNKLPLIIQTAVSPPYSSGAIYCEFNNTKESFCIIKNYYKPISQTLIIDEKIQAELF